MKITIWSDFACPYCYIGESRLHRAINELRKNKSVEIEYKAFELDPEASTRPVDALLRLQRKYGLSESEARERVDAIDKLGAEIGIDFRYATARYSNTRDAHRLMKMAADKYSATVVEALNLAVFDAYFTKNLVLSDRDVLLSLADKAGMDIGAARDMLDSDDYIDDVRDDEREAMLRGVKGVPYIVFNNRYVIPGALSVDALKSAIEHVTA